PRPRRRRDRATHQAGRDAPEEMQEMQPPVEDPRIPLLPPPEPRHHQPRHRPDPGHPQPHHRPDPEDHPGDSRRDLALRLPDELYLAGPLEELQPRPALPTRLVREVRRLQVAQVDDPVPGTPDPQAEREVLMVHE